MKQTLVLLFLYAHKSGIGSCIALKAGLARRPAKGRCGAEVSGFYSSGVLVSCCPGPGGSWGNLTVPPPSKEGESPSNKVLLVAVTVTVSQTRAY